jgi:hypothetical protein
VICSAPFWLPPTARWQDGLSWSAASAIPGAAGRELRRTIDEASDWFESVRTGKPGSVRRHAQGDSVNPGEWRSSDLRVAARKRAGDITAALARAGAAKQLPADDAVSLHQMAVALNQFADSCED